jgi:hypothetical protein
MKASVEVINPYHKKKLTQLFTMKFTKLKLMGADLGLGQNVGLGFYKVVTFFFTKYRNQHQFVILEGVDLEGIPVYLLTELCSTNSGSGSSNGRSGYFLYYSREVEQLLLATNQKNPVCNYTFPIMITGEDVFEGVTREKEKYKIIGNNCQDYAERFIRFILEKSQENMKNDSIDDLHLSEILSFKKKKKKGKKYKQSLNIDDSSESNNSNQDEDDEDSKDSNNSQSISISISNDKWKKKDKNKKIAEQKKNKEDSKKKRPSGSNLNKMMNTADQFNKNKIKNLSEKLLSKNNENNARINDTNVQPRFFNLRLKNDIVKETSEKTPSFPNNNLAKLNNTTENFLLPKNIRQRLHTADTNNELRNEVIENKLKESGLLRNKNDNILTTRDNNDKHKLNIQKQDLLMKENTPSHTNTVNHLNMQTDRVTNRKSITLRVPESTKNTNIQTNAEVEKGIKNKVDSKDIKESVEFPIIIHEKVYNEEKKSPNYLKKKEEFITNSFNKKNESCDGSIHLTSNSKINLTIRDKKLFNTKGENPVIVYNKEINNNSHEITKTDNIVDLTKNKENEGSSLRMKKIRSDVIPMKMFYNTSNNFTQHVERLLLRGKENQNKKLGEIISQSSKVGLYKQGVITEELNNSFISVDANVVEEKTKTKIDKKISSSSQRKLKKK